MSKTPLFSVILATYGRPQMLAEAVASVQSQTVDDFECIVVDDAGPHPASVPEDPRFRLVRREENGGFAAALNTGLEHARGRYVAFIDDDDLYSSDRLALGLEGLQRAPLTFCWERYLDASSGGGRVLEGVCGDSILDHLTPSLGTVSIREDLAGRFDERFTSVQDVEWWLRTAQKTPVTTIKKVGYLFRRHDGPRNRNGVTERVRCNLLLMQTHPVFFASHPRAAAFRWKRVGLMANRAGDQALARTAFVRSLRLNPEPKNVWHLLRSVRTSTARLIDPELTRTGQTV